MKRLEIKITDIPFGSKISFFVEPTEESNTKTVKVEQLELTYDTIYHLPNELK